MNYLDAAWVHSDACIAGLQAVTNRHCGTRPRTMVSVFLQQAADQKRDVSQPRLRLEFSPGPLYEMRSVGNGTMFTVASNSGQAESVMPVRLTGIGRPPTERHR